LKNVVMDISEKVTYDVEESPLTEKQKQSLRSLVKLLSPRLCYDAEASLTLQATIKEFFSFSQKLKWIGENGTLRDGHSAYVPCEEDAKWWIDGYWQPIPMYSTLFNQEIAASRCPVVVEKRGLRTCLTDEALDGHCADAYFPMCDYFIAGTQKAKDKDCLMYSFGIDGNFLVENYFA
jgi:hypothetical protein